MPTHIMVFNHSKEILMLIDEVLSETGYEVFLSAYDLHELAEIERVKPDLIILDCTYRQEDSGWEVLQQLRLRRSTASIRGQKIKSPFHSALEIFHNHAEL